MTEKIKGMSLVPNGTESDLNQRQLEDYRSHRRTFLIWCLTQGKQPETNTGYSEETMKVRHYRINNFYRWVWENRGYTTTVTYDDADEFLRVDANTCPSYRRGTVAVFLLPENYLVDRVIEFDALCIDVC